ncbi:MAG: mechanosensitive ion channel family protein [Candidatus Kapaibacterium sp.]
MDLNNSFSLILEKIETWLALAIASLPNFVVAVLVILLFLIIGKAIKKAFLKVFSKYNIPVAVKGLLGTLIFMAVLIAGFIIALGILNLDKTVTSLLAGLGIIGLALGFAFQDIAQNFVSGILITTKQPFIVGDIIESGGHTGVVYEINLRNTILQTFQGQRILIPNRMVYSEPLTNYSATGESRIDLALGVSYGDDLDKVEKITKETVEKLDNIIHEKGVALFYDSFGDSSINFTVRFWVSYTHDKNDFVAARHQAIKMIKKAYDENDIAIPFPIRTLDFGIKGGEKLDSMISKRNGG